VILSGRLKRGAAGMAPHPCWEVQNAKLMWPLFLREEQFTELYGTDFVLYFKLTSLRILRKYLEKSVMNFL
jgi:hypothetical protein